MICERGLQGFYQTVRIKALVRKPYQVRAALIVGPPRFGRPYRGYCIHCGRDATKELLFKEKGGIIVERYCDACSVYVLSGKKFFAMRVSELGPNGHTRSVTL